MDWSFVRAVGVFLRSLAHLIAQSKDQAVVEPTTVAPHGQR
jgi:hypothetical protein